MRDQRFDLLTQHHHHRVQVHTGLPRAVVRWFVDDVLWGEGRSMSREFEITGENPSHGRLLVEVPIPTRHAEVLLLGPDEQPADDTPGGIDLAPWPGSPAARHQQLLRDHPGRYLVWSLLGPVLRWGVGMLLSMLGLGIVLGLVLVISWPTIPWPTIPWPSVSWPSIPLPNLPQIPWPDWRLPDLPGWVGTAFKLTCAALVAGGFAHSRLERRREQDERRELDEAARRRELLLRLARGLREAQADAGKTTRAPSMTTPLGPSTRTDPSAQPSTVSS